MTHKAKPDAEFLRRLTEWEGSPMVNLPEEYQSYLKSFVPRFHLCAYGPVAMGQLERMHLVIDNLVAESYEAAEQHMWDYIHYLSDQWVGYEFDAEDWDIDHIVLNGGN